MAFIPHPGTEFTLNGEWRRVETYDRRAGYLTLVDTNGVVTLMALEELVHHPAVALPNERKAVVDISGEMSDAQKRIAMLRIAEVQEVLTGYRSGDPNDALPGEPRPEYDPSLTKREKYATKRRELDTPLNRQIGLAMSISTMRRIEDAIKHGQALVHSFGHHKPRRSGGRRKMPTEVEEATKAVINARRGDSSTTLTTLCTEAKRLLVNTLGEQWVRDNFPSYSTWWRWVSDRYTKSELSGKARTRESATDVPEGGFNRSHLSRPGELVILDTNNLDVLLKGTIFEGVIRGSLVVAIDGYSWSCCALRLVEQSETALDVSMVLLDVMRPKQMRPEWGSDYRWPFIGIPSHLLATVGGFTEVAGMPVVNPEAVALDHGATYKTHKMRDLEKRFQFDLLPARVRTGSDKVPVERFFGALRSMLLEHFKGYRGSDPSERGKNVDASVEWTAQALEDAIMKWVVLGWQTHIMDDHKPDWCPEGEWSPNDLYQHGLSTTGWQPRILTAEDYYSVLVTRLGKVHSRGVKVNGLWYDAPLLDDYRNVPSKTGSKRWHTLHDPRDLRTVYFIDGHGDRHVLRWVGATGDLPAFSLRHLNALRKRVGNLDRYDSDELALILITKILPVPVEVDETPKGRKKANAAASRHARDQQLIQQDAAKHGVDLPTPETPTVEPAATPAAAVADQATVVESVRRKQRTKATATAPVEAAPALGSGRRGLLGGYDSEDGAA